MWDQPVVRPSSYRTKHQCSQLYNNLHFELEPRTTQQTQNKQEQTISFFELEPRKTKTKKLKKILKKNEIGV